MVLAYVPLLFSVAGLILYVVLAGPDFGAAIWQLGAGPGNRGERLRNLTHDAMAPVWEANHVWLIFVLTVMWTAYPAAFASIATTLSAPLLVAGVGIIVRGAAYALRSGTRTSAEVRRVDLLSSLASIVTPFALGAALGGIASARVPVGNAAGSLITSWLNPTSIVTGTLAVATSAYLAAVFLAGDAVRLGHADLAEAFRRRALGAGVVAGTLALAGVIVLRQDATPIYHGLTHGRGIPAIAVSAVGGVATIALVLRRRYEPARASAAVAVAAIVVGWALAQAPHLLPGLSIDDAAAGRETLVAVTIAIVVGAILVLPSLAVLFSLTLGGTLRHGGESAAEAPSTRELVGATAGSGLALRTAAASLLLGAVCLTALDAGWAHVIGIVALAGFVVAGFVAVAPRELAAAAGEDG